MSSLFFLSACSSLVLEEVEKQSTCELEVDAVAVDVLNRLEIESKITQDNSPTCCTPPPVLASIVAHSDTVEGIRQGGRKNGERSSAESSLLKVQHF